MSYDGIPSYTVSIMEFRQDLWPTKRNILPIGSSPDRRGRILSSAW